jgi:hypothetical protein
MESNRGRSSFFENESESGYGREKEIEGFAEHKTRLALSKYSSFAPFASLREERVLCGMIPQFRGGTPSNQCRPTPASKPNPKIASLTPSLH